jgi:hypothetical protein
MGKVILTEKQYKNLNQSLINEVLRSDKKIISEAISEERAVQLAGAQIQLSKLFKKVSGYMIDYPTAQDVTSFYNLMVLPKNCEEAAAQFKGYANGPNQIANAFFNEFVLGDRLAEESYKYKNNVNMLLSHYKKIGYTSAKASITNNPDTGNATYKKSPFSFGTCKALATPEEKKALTKLGTDYIIKNFSACVNKFPQVMPDKTGWAQYKFPNNWVWQRKNANGQVYFVVGDSNYKFIRNLKDCNDEIFKTTPTNQTVVNQQTNKKQRNTAPKSDSGGGSDFASLDW